MTKRILLNFFGQLRFWDLQDTIEPFKNYFVEQGYKVTIHGTFWDDEYVKKFNNQNKLDIFDKLNLVEEPNLEPLTLQKYFYSLEKSCTLINDEYDLIISSRPDIFFKITKQKHTFSNLLNNVKNDEIYVQKEHYQNKNHKYEKHMWWIDDKIFISNQYTLNKISQAFKYYIDKRFNFDLEYHYGLVWVLDFFNIKIINDVEFFRIDMIRHWLYSQYPHEGGYQIGDNLVRNIEKKYQDTDKWIEYIKKVQKIQNHLTD